jgi:segregation and condensation protein B
MTNLKQHLEALIFTAEQSITLEEIKACLKTAINIEISTEDLSSYIVQLQNKYDNDVYAFELVEVAGGFQFLSKKEYQETVSVLLQQKAKKRLSNSAMETLAIIAYRQPITKSEMEHIRGVNCDYSVQKLLEKDLIEISGKSDGPGKPVLYSTSKTFMDYFGINTVKDLPQLKDVYIEQNEIGIPTTE